jgi:alkylation response protein AidB-like acyl-CoA dehydrogenase
VLHGQKVWTSYAQFARWGIALVRTDPDLPKHRGLSYLVVDMTLPGVEIRPLVTITGESEFNEVFLDEVFVPTDCLVGERNRGWAVANTTLAHERGTFPFKEEVVHGVYLEELYHLAEELGTIDDPDVADALATAAVKLRVLRLANLRTLTKLAKGEEVGPESSVVKLTWSDMTQTMSDAALLVVSAAAPLWEGASDNPGRGTWQRQWLWSKAATIAGGTSEIQRTVIGDRILGLPR